MIARLHYLTQDTSEKSPAEQTLLACKGGADWIQLRIKKKPMEEIKDIAIQTRKICREFGAKLIVNDYVELAKEVNADGVHLGKEDMNPAEARKVLGDDFIIGGTANTLEDVLRNIYNGCNYIGLGPLKPTSTKEKLSPLLGFEGIQQIMNSLLTGRFPDIPVIAIGGVIIADVEPLLDLGVHGIAVSSAINNSSDISLKTAEFLSETGKFANQDCRVGKKSGNHFTL